MKKITSYTIDEKVVEKFNIITTLKGKRMSNVIEDMMKDYIIMNTAEANELINRMNL